MVGCFGTNFLSSATYMGEKPLLLHDTYFSKENTKVYNRYQSYFWYSFGVMFSSYRV